MPVSELCSIIIPTHRRPLRLVAAINSVLAQTDPNWELWIICDGPDPDTETALVPFLADPRIHLLVQAHSGVSAARNRGISHSRGPWIAFLDDDDLWQPRKLERQRAWMARTGYLACQCDEIWIRHGKRVNPMKKHAKPSGWIFPQCVDLCCVSPSAVMLHRRLFDIVGYFNPDFPVCEDYDLWLRLSLRFPVGLMPESLITKYGGHDDQLSRRYHSMDEWRITALEAILHAPLLNEKPHWRRHVISSITKRAAILASGAKKRGNLATYEHFITYTHKHENHLTTVEEA